MPLKGPLAPSLGPSASSNPPCPRHADRACCVLISALCSVLKPFLAALPASAVCGPHAAHCPVHHWEPHSLNLNSCCLSDPLCHGLISSP